MSDAAQSTADKERIIITNLLTNDKILDSPNTLVETPLFNHSSYRIKVELWPKNYNSTYFRKTVRWDFGDGTIVDGYSAEHSYKKPGKYTITCTLYDLDRKPYTLKYQPSIIVREIIPTNLTFLNTNSDWKSSYSACKNNKIGKLLVTIGNNIVSEPTVSFIRKWNNSTARDTNYFDIKNDFYYHLEPYYTFLEEYKETSIDSLKRFKTVLRPVNYYTPKYTQLYGYFTVNNGNSTLNLAVVGNNIGISTIKTINPKYSTRTIYNKSANANSYNVTTPIKYYPTYKDLEKAAGTNIIEEVGKISILNIWYKNDITGINDIILQFTPETIKIKNEVASSSEYLNIPSLGYTFNITSVNTNNIVSGLTSNGILSDTFDGSSTLHIEKHLQHNLYVNYPIEAFYANFIKNDKIEGENDSFNLVKSIIENRPLYNLRGNEQSVLTVNDYRLYFNPEIKDLSKDYIKHYIIIPKESLEIFDGDKSIYKKHNILDLNELIIPSEKIYKEDSDKVLDVYMSHPMYEGKTNIKTFLNDILNGKQLLSYITTKGKNFVDDHVNYKTCYIDKLADTLKMIGETTPSYDITLFDKVNDLKDITRIMSMKYSDLFGIILTNLYDIRMSHNYVGANISNKLDINDIIICDKDYNIIALRRGKNIIKLKDSTWALVLKEDINFETRLVNLLDVETSNFETYEDQSDEWHSLNAELINNTYFAFSFADYDKKWNWGLNLHPDSENVIDKRRFIDACYTFYLFNPNYEIKRVHNFLQENTIPLDSNGKQLSPEQWSEDFGFLYDCLMKVLTSNLGLRE